MVYCNRLLTLYIVISDMTFYLSPSPHYVCIAIPARIPSFTPLTRRLSVVEDDSAAFTCHVEGRPTPTITWTFKGSVVSRLLNILNTSVALFASLHTAFISVNNMMNESIHFCSNARFLKRKCDLSVFLFMWIFCCGFKVYDVDPDECVYLRSNSVQYNGDRGSILYTLW